MMRVLVVDDDAETLEVVSSALRRGGHQVLCAESPTAALEVLRSTSVELLVLDVMLGPHSGLDLCRHLRDEGFELPIILLSARGAVGARVDGLDSGADDYLPKPFALLELVARVRALGRRGPSMRVQRLEVGPLLLDFEARRATAQDVEIAITSREWEVLRVLGDARGRVVPFDSILERAWGDVTDKTRASLEVIVSRLRKKLLAATGSPLIRTVRSLGYSLDPEI